MSDSPLERAVGELERRGLAAPALLLLEAHRPLRPLLSVGATFLLPVTRPLWREGAEALERTLLDEAEYDRLLARLRAGAGG
ncbi:MAG TPA: hypothetical protein VHK63_00480 [Candidatus Limnocylindria bacterium]|nr:hypothetical protein [Candidatus Limnocylindria bacterium]